MKDDKEEETNERWIEHQKRLQVILSTDRKLRTYNLARQFLPPLFPYLSEFYKEREKACFEKARSDFEALLDFNYICKAFKFKKKQLDKDYPIEYLTHNFIENSLGKDFNKRYKDALSTAAGLILSGITKGKPGIYKVISQDTNNGRCLLLEILSKEEVEIVDQDLSLADLKKDYYLVGIVFPHKDIYMTDFVYPIDNKKDYKFVDDYLANPSLLASIHYGLWLRNKLATLSAQEEKEQPKAD